MVARFPLYCGARESQAGHDILSMLSRRWPCTRHVRVQGASGRTLAVDSNNPRKMRKSSAPICFILIFAKLPNGQKQSAKSCTCAINSPSICEVAVRGYEEGGPKAEPKGPDERVQWSRPQIASRSPLCVSPGCCAEDGAGDAAGRRRPHVFGAVCREGKQPTSLSAEGGCVLSGMCVSGGTQCTISAIKLRTMSSLRVRSEGGCRRKKGAKRRASVMLYYNTETEGNLVSRGGPDPCSFQ